MKQREYILNHIDSGLECQIEGERIYWVNVLKRVEATVVATKCYHPEG